MRSPFLKWFLALALTSVCVATACSPPRLESGTTPASRSVNPDTAGALTITGDPEANEGAAWAFRGTPGAADVSGMRIPYQMHHGDADDVVPVSCDERLASLLQRFGVAHELYLYPGGHLAPRSSPLMLERVHAWYAAHGMF